MQTQFELNIKNYWNYYIELENEVLETRKYVEFDVSNYKCFSIEFLKLFQAICSEIDTLGKHIANILDFTYNPDDKKNTIYKWWYILSNKLKLANCLKDGCNNNDKINVKTFSVRNYILDIYVNPWENFEVEQYTNKKGAICYRLTKNSKNLKWWSEYNDVKHHRTSLNHKNKESNYAYANLGNVLSSLTALYILEIGLLQLTGSVNELESFVNKSSIFNKEFLCTSEEIELICQ